MANIDVFISAKWASYFYAVSTLMHAVGMHGAIVYYMDGAELGSLL